MTDPMPASRRDFLKGAIASIGGLLAAAIGIPAIAFVVGSSLEPDASDWLRLGPLSDVKTGVPTLFKPRITRKQGWIQEDEQLGIFVHTDDGREYTALSNVCTHLGCKVRWISEHRQYHSPCHNGVFDAHGYVVSGPPPRPLDEYETRIEDGILYAKLPAVRRTA